MKPQKMKDSVTVWRIGDLPEFSKTLDVRIDKRFCPTTSTSPTGAAGEGQGEEVAGTAVRRKGGG